jgi:uncharacterized protein YggE
MTESAMRSISVSEQLDLEAKPDIASIKLHVTGEGITMEDAVASARKRVAETTEALKTNHKAISNITILDVYFGQKEERYRTEPQSFPRPLVVQGVLIAARPDDQKTLYRIIDDGIKHGAVLDSPHRHSYMSDILDSALLFGLVDSEKYEQEAVERCLRRAEHRIRATASAAQKTIGKLIEVSGVTVEPSLSEPFRKDYVHIRRSFPTQFLSPTPQKVLLSAKLTAKFELRDS